MNDLLLRIIDFAKEQHDGQSDKGGMPYWLHLKYVADRVKCHGIKYEIAGWCHDLIEDTDTTFGNLMGFGVPEDIIFAIDCITKRPHEKKQYDLYLNRVLQSEIATVVKIADLHHNMQLARIPAVGPKDIDRLKKYIDAVAFLECNKIKKSS